MKATLLSLSLFIALSITNNIEAQIITIQGTIKDAITDSLLVGASIKLVSELSHKIIGTRQLENSLYIFSKIKPDKYLVIGSFLGYDQDTVKLDIERETLFPVVINLRLTRQIQMLQKIIVLPKIQALLFKEDTISFNTLAFPTPKYSKIQDLLLKLPGIEMDLDGSITFEGKKVDKILLDGKEYIIDDLKSLTQNLTADLVSRIETFSTQSIEGKLTGMPGGNTGKTINIILKPDKRSGLLVNSFLGLGIKNNYSTGGFATKLGESRFIMGTFTSDNINNQFNGQESNIGAGNGGMQKYTNGTQDYRVEKANGFILTLNARENDNTTSTISNTQIKTFLPDSSLLENRLNRFLVHEKIFSFSASFDYTLDSMTKIIFNPAGSSQSTSNSSTDSVLLMSQNRSNNITNSNLQNSGYIENNSSSSGYSFTNNLYIQHKFKIPRKVLFINFYQRNAIQNGRSAYSSLTSLIDSLQTPIENSFLSFHSSQVTSNKDLSGKISLTQPLGTVQTITLAYEYNNAASLLSNSANDLDTASKIYDLQDTLLTTRFVAGSQSHLFSIRYSGFSKRFQYNIELTGQSSLVFNKEKIKNSYSKQSVFNSIPKADLRYTFRNGNPLTFNYAGTTLNPSINQLKSTPDISNPFLVIIGNQNLRTQFSHNLNAMYSCVNKNNLSYFQISIGATTIQNKIVTSTLVLANDVQQSAYVNVNGNVSLNYGFLYNFPIGHKKGCITLYTRLAFDHENNLLQGKFNSLSTTESNNRFKLIYHEGKYLFFDCSSNIIITKYRYDLNANQNESSLKANSRINISYTLQNLITFTTFYNLLTFSGVNNLTSQNISLLNASIYKLIFRYKSCQIRLTGFDLLNSNKSYSVTEVNNSVEIVRTNSIGRIFLLSLVYNLERFMDNANSRNRMEP